MSIVNLSAPWIEHYRKLQAMFEYDPNVSVVYDSANMTCNLYVEGKERADALTKLLKPTVEFGNVIMSIVVHPSNEMSEKYTAVGRRAFNVHGNARYRIHTDDIHLTALSTSATLNRVEFAYGPGGAVFTYVIFTPEVVQYFNDDVSDYFGLKSALYEDIARDIFIEETGVFYCTDKKIIGEEVDTIKL